MQIKKAMIFAAGLGTRFKPWTDAHPKALAVVNGKPLLQRNIEYLQQYGIRDVVVNVHHFPEQVRDAVSNSGGWGSNIVISDETDEVLETGGGLLKARPLLEGEPFVTLNADFLTNLDLNRLAAYHQQKQALISFAVTNRISSRNFLFDADSRLCGWMNNSTGERRIAVESDALKAMAYSCVAIFEPQVFDLIPQRGKFSLVDTYLSLAPGHPIYGFDHSGDKLVDVGRPESVAVAEDLFP